MLSCKDSGGLVLRCTRVLGIDGSRNSLELLAFPRDASANSEFEKSVSFLFCQIDFLINQKNLIFLWLQVIFFS